MRKNKGERWANSLLFFLLFQSEIDLERLNSVLDWISVLSRQADINKRCNHNSQSTMKVITLSTQKFTGLIELDEAGKVLDFSPDGDASGAPKDDAIAQITGHDFFSEIAPFDNVNELRRRFDYFMGSNREIESFNFACQCGKNLLSVRVMMVRIHDELDKDRTKSILIQIKKAH